MSVDPVSSSIPLPPELRGASSERQQAWRAGAGFEQQLLAQILKPVTDGLLGGDDDADPAASVYSGQLGDVLAGSVVAGGGIGLAQQLADQIEKKDQG